MEINKLLIGFGLCLSLPVAAVAGSSTNKGSNPKGKPFIEIQGQIVEVEGAVSTLNEKVALMVGDVETLEGRITANEQAIADLQAQSDDLQTQIDISEDSVTEVLAEIDRLKEDNADLHKELLDLGGVDVYLEELIDANQAQIVALQGSLDAAVLATLAQIIDLESQVSQMEGDLAVAQVQLADLEGDTVVNTDAIAQLNQGIEELQSQIGNSEQNIENLQSTLDNTRTDLQGQIDDNSTMIAILKTDQALLQMQIDEKQDRVNGICNSGTAAVEINEDGTMICDPIYSDQVMVSYQASSSFKVVAFSYAVGNVQCKPGFRVTGGGHLKPATIAIPNIDVWKSAPINARTWQTRVLNRSILGTGITIYAVCVALS